MAQPWSTYAALVHGSLTPTPGAKKTMAEVQVLRSMGRVDVREFKDNGLKVYQFRMKEVA